MAPLPAYMRIRHYVNDLLMSHPDHAVRIMSERELCSRFDVTRPTARRALKDLVDDGSLCVKPGLGMFINSARVKNHAFALKKSYKIMVVFGNGRQTDLDGFCIDVLSRIGDRLKYLPVRMQIANLNQSDSGMALEELEMYNPDGILWVRPSRGSAELINVVRRKMPVYIAGHVANGDKCSVTADYYQGGRLAACWFLDRKLRNVLFVGGSIESDIKSRVLDGWLDEFSVRGSAYDESMLVNVESDIVRECKHLVAAREVNGIFSFGSEFPAVDIALTECGVTREKCPVMMDRNYYGEHGASVHPSVRLILLPSEVPALAAESLFKMLSDPGFKPEEIVLSPEIENINQKQKEENHGQKA